MATFDLIVIAVLALSAAIGAWRGLVGEALALVAWILALVAAWFFGSQVGAALFAGVKEPAFRTAFGFGVTIVSVLVGMALIKWLARGLLKALGLSLTDRLANGNDCGLDQEPIRAPL